MNKNDRIGKLENQVIDLQRRIDSQSLILDQLGSVVVGKDPQALMYKTKQPSIGYPIGYQGSKPVEHEVIRPIPLQEAVVAILEFLDIKLEHLPAIQASFFASDRHWGDELKDSPDKNLPKVETEKKVKK